MQSAMEDFDYSTLSPKQTDDLRIELCARYQQYSDRMIELEIARAEIWPDIRKSAKSVKDAELEFDRTDNGKEIIFLKYQLRATEKKISALRDRMQRYNNEARNYY